jgi:hypothetical protein
MTKLFVGAAAAMLFAGAAFAGEPAVETEIVEAEAAVEVVAADAEAEVEAVEAEGDAEVEAVEVEVEAEATEEAPAE